MFLPTDCNVQDCKSSYINLHQNVESRSNDLEVPNIDGISQGKFPIQIIECEVLVEYCRLLEDLLMRRHQPRRIPVYDSRQ